MRIKLATCSVYDLCVLLSNQNRRKSAFHRRNFEDLEKIPVVFLSMLLGYIDILKPSLLGTCKCNTNNCKYKILEIKNAVLFLNFVVAEIIHKPTAKHCDESPSNGRPASLLTKIIGTIDKAFLLVDDKLETLFYYDLYLRKSVILVARLSTILEFLVSPLIDVNLVPVNISENNMFSLLQKIQHIYHFFFFNISIMQQFKILFLEFSNITLKNYIFQFIDTINIILDIASILCFYKDYINHFNYSKISCSNFELNLTEQNQTFVISFIIKYLAIDQPLSVVSH
ncbi:hypothetical protein AGLY_011629 [Aphis glycines]|uniref:Uncharacterized protein n=1 Tax=Aphis glycines TaxID=307491 RepID=A0A6G0TAQ5_APHGL|nr:hypothetical protein AGLY_011629 [Aphis glycines]